MAVLVKLAWGQRFAIGSDLVAPRFEASRGGQHVENRVGWYQSNPLNIGKRGGTTFVDTWCDLVVPRAITVGRSGLPDRFAPL